MYDFLKFIDSPDIREYNKDTQFTPAEWAVLVRASIIRTVEEKIEALQYLLDHYQENEFGGENVNIDPPTYPPYKTDIPFREIVKRTVELWNDILNDRNREEDVIYAAHLGEKGDRREDLDDYCFFTSYKSAYAYLLNEKQEYLEDENLKGVETYGEIRRIRIADNDSDRYLFDTGMRMVDIVEGTGRMLYEDGELFSPLSMFVYKIFVPLPFQKGDIVKVEHFFAEPDYGVISHEWEKPEKREQIKMWMSLDIYDSAFEDFDYTDGMDSLDDGVLCYSFCTDEELPEDQQVLKLIRDMRKGELDFYTLLHKFGRKELDELLMWQSKK